MRIQGGLYGGENIRIDWCGCSSLLADRLNNYMVETCHTDRLKLEALQIKLAEATSALRSMASPDSVLLKLILDEMSCIQN